MPPPAPRSGDLIRGSPVAGPLSPAASCPSWKAGSRPRRQNPGLPGKEDHLKQEEQVSPLVQTWLRRQWGRAARAATGRGIPGARKRERAMGGIAALVIFPGKTRFRINFLQIQEA